MFLLLVVWSHVTGRLLQADGYLVVVGDSLTRCLAVLIETHLLVVDDTVHVVPRPVKPEQQDQVMNSWEVRDLSRSRGSWLLPVGRLLVVALPLVFAVQEPLQLWGRVLVLGGQRGWLADFTLPGGGRGGGGAGLLGAPLRHAVHQISTVNAVLNTVGYTGRGLNNCDRFSNVTSYTNWV